MSHEIESLSLVRNEEPDDEGVPFMVTLSCSCGFASPPFQAPALAFALGAVSILCEMYPPPNHEERNVSPGQQRILFLKGMPVGDRGVLVSEGE